MVKLFGLSHPAAKSHFSPGKPFSSINEEQDNYLKSTVVKLRLSKKIETSGNAPS